MVAAAFGYYTLYGTKKPATTASLYQAPNTPVPSNSQDTEATQALNSVNQSMNDVNTNLNNADSAINDKQGDLSE
jgi:hypothetical protein